MEIWKQAPAPFDRYEVSRSGEVRNSSGYVLRGKRSVGYMRVGLQTDTGPRTLLVHRLVAMVFLDLSVCDKRLIVHHLSGDTQDNRVDNLVCLTPKEHGAHKTPTESTKQRPVLQLSVEGVLIRRWPSVTGVPYNKSLIVKALKTQSVTYGCRWIYEVLHVEGEVWDTVCLYGDSIRVSSKGRVVCRSGKISYGWGKVYRSVPLGGKYICVHRLVAMAFLPPPENPTQTTVNHKNLNKQDNGVENLEWASQSENNLHAANLYPKHVVFCRGVRRQTEGGWETFSSIQEASQKTGVPKGNICMACRKQRPKAGGFVWEYLPEP